MEAAEFCPLTPPVFHVMVALADGEKHGYAILKDVEADTGGTVEMSTGTLYAIIKRLLHSGLIEETDARRPRDDQRRRYYRLTGLGRRVVIAEARRMEAMLAGARQKRLLRLRD